MHLTEDPLALAIGAVFSPAAFRDGPFFFSTVLAFVTERVSTKSPKIDFFFISFMRSRQRNPTSEDKRFVVPLEMLSCSRTSASGEVARNHRADSVGAGRAYAGNPL